MIRLSRRDFVRLGAGGLSGFFASTGMPQPARSDAPAVPVEHAFLIEPGLISRLKKDTSELSSPSLRALPGEFESPPSSLLSPVSFDLDQLEQWARERTSNCCSVTLPALDASSDLLDVVMQVPIAGGPAVSDITAETFTSLSDRAAVDVGVEFLHCATTTIARQCAGEYAVRTRTIWPQC
jgi:hypothetical protein